MISRNGGRSYIRERVYDSDGRWVRMYFYLIHSIQTTYFKNNHTNHILTFISQLSSQNTLFKWHYFLIIERLFGNSGRLSCYALSHFSLKLLPCSSGDAFLSSTICNAQAMLVPSHAAPPPPPHPSISISISRWVRLPLKVDWESFMEGPTPSLFRSNGRKQSTLTQKPSVATSILIFLARHTYLYIGLH